MLYPTCVLCLIPILVSISLIFGYLLSILIDFCPFLIILAEFHNFSYILLYSRAFFDIFDLLLHFSSKLFAFFEYSCIFLVISGLFRIFLAFSGKNLFHTFFKSLPYVLDYFPNFILLNADSPQKNL